MKNIKKSSLIIYFILLILYEEIIFSLIIFKEFPKSILLITMFSIPISIIATFLAKVFKPKANKIITYAITGIIFVIFGAQIVYYSMYEAIISFFSFVNGGQVADFMDVIFDMILRNWYGILLFALPIVILIILNRFKILDYEKIKLKEFLVELALGIVIQILALVCVNTIATEDIYSNKNLYNNIHVPKITANRMGLITAMRLDLKRFIFGFEENLQIQNEENEKTKETKKIEYNITEINFDELIENEKNNTINQMHKYFSTQQASAKNKYTGMFKGKNLIVIVGEAFSSLAIDENLTPNLYRLYNQGFQFDNFYTPIFPVSTADGEYITDTSLIPKEGVWSMYVISGNYMPYSYANVLEKLGYTSNAYHNHTATYYERDKYIKTMGYDSYLAVGTGLEKRMFTRNWPNSDYEMMQVTMDDYINNDKFLAYYMTVSGHLNYTREGNMMVYRNWDLVKDLPYSNKVKSYLSCNIELDKAIGEIFKKLEETGKLEDTVIVLSGDHYPYGLTLTEMNELSKYERDDTFEKYKMPLLIWSGSMKEPIKVEKLGSSLDVLPTVLNLFGIEFDSRLLIGRDILSDTSPLVIFSDRSFITDKGKYNAVKEEFIPNEGYEVEEDYVKKINEIIYSKYQMSRLILENDYYKYVLPENITGE